MYQLCDDLRRPLSHPAAHTCDLVGGAYQPRFYIQDQLTYDSSAGEFVLTDTKGDQVRYYDFSTSLPAAQRGAFKSFTDPGGVATAEPEKGTVPNGTSLACKVAFNAPRTPRALRSCRFPT